jgi:hypothetical protein
MLKERGKKITQNSLPSSPIINYDIDEDEKFLNLFLPLAAKFILHEIMEIDKS